MTLSLTLRTTSVAFPIGRRDVETHKKPRATRECVRLGLYIVLWLIVSIGTIYEVVVESKGLPARITIATLAFVCGLVTYRLFSMFWGMYTADRKKQPAA